MTHFWITHLLFRKQNDFSLRKVQLEKCLSLGCPKADPKILTQVQIVYLGSEKNNLASEAG